MSVSRCILPAKAVSISCALAYAIDALRTSSRLGAASKDELNRGLEEVDLALFFLQLL